MAEVKKKAGLGKSSIGGVAKDLGSKAKSEATEAAKGVLALAVKAEAMGRRSEPSSEFSVAGERHRITAEMKRHSGPVGAAVLSISSFFGARNRRSSPDITPAADQDPEPIDREPVAVQEQKQKPKQKPKRFDFDENYGQVHIPLVDGFDERQGELASAGRVGNFRSGFLVQTMRGLTAAASALLSRINPRRSHAESRKAHDRSSARRSALSRALAQRAMHHAAAIARTFRTAVPMKRSMSGGTSGSISVDEGRRVFQSGRIVRAVRRDRALWSPERRETGYVAGIVTFGIVAHAWAQHAGTRSTGSGAEVAVTSKRAARTTSETKARPATLAAAHASLNGETSGRQASAPMAALRPASSPSRAHASPIHPTLAMPAPLADALQRIVDPGMPDGDDMLSLADSVDAVVGEELIPRIMKQLKAGPEALSNDDFRREVNGMLPEGYEPIGRETWVALLQETLLVAIRQIRPFGDDCLRRAEQIYGDAAMLLQLADKREAAVKLLAAWETHFGMHALAENLADPDVSSLGKPLDLHEDFVRAIKLHLVERASALFARVGYGDTARYSFETRVQWAVARHSAIPDDEHKVRRTASFIVDLAKKNRIAAGRMLALIVRHSALSRNRAQKKNPLVPQWQSDELRQLVKAVMEEAPRVVNDCSLREHLTDWEKKALNNLIYKANYGDIMTKLSRMGSDRPIEDYIDAIAEADESGRVFLDIVLDMLRNHEKHNKLS